MKYYFLALGTIIVVCVGCASDGGQFLDKGKYAAPPAAMLQRPGPMVDGPGPGVLPMPVPAPPAFVAKTSQLRFLNPKGMQSRLGRSRRIRGQPTGQPRTLQLPSRGDPTASNWRTFPSGPGWFSIRRFKSILPIPPRMPTSPTTAFRWS